jgi:dihydroorotate dehydrogenase (NAD+) catalytic subunit
MLNSVGLQGPGVPAWLATDLPALQDAHARVVVSIWGRTVEEFEKASAMLAGEGNGAIVAIEVNLSCPNLGGGAHLFAHSARATRDVVAAVVATSGALPVWAKLTAHVTDLSEVAGAAESAGAAAVTVTNTLLGMAIDVDTRSYRLGSGANGGGLSGSAIHPVAVRAVHDVHRALPDLPVVGVGGVSTATDAIELLLAGASAVQVGSATFADPRAPLTVLEGLEDWCRVHQIDRVTDLIGGVHG